VKSLIKLSLPLVLAASLVPMAALAGSDVKLKTDLQVTMQRHIESSLVDGAITSLNMESGALEPLYPTEAHPMVLVGRDFFVLCSELKSADGRQLPVDFYVTETEDGFRVFHTEIDNREPLNKLMADNRVNRL